SPSDQWTATCDHHARRDQETRERRHRVGLPEKPDRHDEHGAVGDQRPSLPGSVVRTMSPLKKTPEGSDPADHADHAEKILAGGDAADNARPRPTLITSPHRRVIFDEKNGHRHQKKTQP